jgi:hypothetical protein
MTTLFAGIQKELKKLDTSTIKMVEFGFIIGGIFLLLSVLAFWNNKLNLGYITGVPGAILFFFGATFPQLLRPIYKLWMGLAFVLGGFVGTIILSLLYYVFVTPIALLVLLFKGNPLDHKTKQGSYWIPREAGWNKQSMEQLF